MAKLQVVTLGFLVSRELISKGMTEETFMDYLSDETNLYGRILLILEGYLIKYIKTFVKVCILVTSKNNKIFPNGTLKGIIEYINRTKVDIAVQPFLNEELSENSWILLTHSS